MIYYISVLYRIYNEIRDMSSWTAAIPDQTLRCFDYIVCTKSHHINVYSVNVNVNNIGVDTNMRSWSGCLTATCSSWRSWWRRRPAATTSSRWTGIKCF